MLDALTLDQLRTFATVAECGSFRAAATKLRRAQSAVSHAVANLEAQLGRTLFDRQGYRPVLTLEGQALLADACVVLSTVDQMRARARGFSQKLELTIAVAVDSCFPFDRLAVALQQLHARHPSVQVDVRSGPLGVAMRSILDGRCAFGVTLTDQLRDPRVELEALGHLRMFAVAAPSHPLASGLGVLGPMNHLQIVVSDPSDLTDGIDFGVAAASTWRVDDLAIKRELLLVGAGWGRLPEHLIRDDLRHSRLVRLRQPELGVAGETTVPMFLARRSDQALGPAGTLLKGALTAQMRA